MCVIYCSLLLAHPASCSLLCILLLPPDATCLSTLIWFYLKIVKTILQWAQHITITWYNPYKDLPSALAFTATSGFDAATPAAAAAVATGVLLSLVLLFVLLVLLLLLLLVQICMSYFSYWSYILVAAALVVFILLLACSVSDLLIFGLWFQH